MKPYNLIHSFHSLDSQAHRRKNEYFVLISDKLGVSLSKQIF